MRKINFIVLTSLLVVVLLIIEVVIVKSVSKYEPEFNVVYAKVKIPPKTEIKADMLKEKKVNISMIHSQAYRSMKDLVGKKTKTDIEEGEMILSSRIGDVDEMKEIKVKDKSNRLFSVEFKSDQANGWWLMVDQYVDILFVPNERMAMIVQAQNQQTANNAPVMQSQPERKVESLKNIRIAALIDDKGKLLENSDRKALPKCISFEVTDKQAEFLAYAKVNGRLEVSVIP